MKLSNFNFNYPEELIAEYPCEGRDESKLMVIHTKTKEIEHKKFKDVIDYLNEDDVLILNNIGVFPARIIGKKEKTNAKAEILLLRRLDDECKIWDVIVAPARKIRTGNKLFFRDDIVAEVIDNTTSRGRIIKFIFDGYTGDEFLEKLKSIGLISLPPYIKRETEKEDRERYKTVFANDIEESVTAPTAGIHFSKHLLKKLEIKGINLAKITLNIGLEVFNRIYVEDLSKHKMQSEKVTIKEKDAKIINEAILNEKNVCACGSTSVRAVESFVSPGGLVKPTENWTKLFIFPKFDFRICNMLLTNFHPPKSSSLIMASAFAKNHEFIMKAYKEAMDKKYNIFSYGDAMLII